MTDAISIRRATLQDVEALVPLRLALERESGHATQEQMLPDLRQAVYHYFLKALPTEAMLIWVAEASEQIVATSGLIFFQKPPSERNLSGLEAYILNMYTLPEWRGRGLATRLLQTLMDYIKQTEAHRIWMYATQDGRPIYEKAGFVLKTRQTLEMELIW
ncbi:MAG TPA: GNAT family N-acetyltransferase [Ktedonobacteraceae bacterium]|jgi:GNAT superfamily N-acetyltransferase|nr:GNAT family N-acetyltransferase [Ktedonobacteraceae bacterium]